jgi:hypothetical protein
MTDSQLHTLRHMLGINTPDDRVPRPYRNYAAVNPGDPEFLELERLGMVERYGEACAFGEYDWYRCTDAGYQAAIASHRKIRNKKSARVYAKFLDVRDALNGLTFREFLTEAAGMTQETDEFSRIIRQRHHLAVARLWMNHSVAALILALPLFVVGLAIDDRRLGAVSVILAAASFACSQLSIRHSDAARKLRS